MDRKRNFFSNLKELRVKITHFLKAKRKKIFLKLVENALALASFSSFYDNPVMTYENNCLLVDGNVREYKVNNDIYFFLFNLNFLNFLFFNGEAIAARIGLFKNGSKIRFSSDIIEIPKRAFIGMHHKNIDESKFENYLQFINSYIFNESTAVITDWPYATKYKLKNFIANTLIKLIFNNKSIKGLGSEEKYWSIVQAIRTHKAVSVFPDRDGQQYFGDTGYFFRDGLFAASLFTEVPILNYAVVESTPSDPYADVYIDLFNPPQASDSFINDCRTICDSGAYAQWRLDNFEKIQLFTRQCEEKHQQRILEIESKKASCAFDSEFGTCAINAQREILLKKNFLLKSKRDECYLGNASI